MSQQKHYPIDRLKQPINRFISQEKSGGIVLGLSVILALILANSSWSSAYFHFFENKFGFQFNGVSYLEYSIHHWINDGLMAVFFFVVGLELKREIVAGELSNPRKAMLPIIAAIGGMVIPAAIYLLFNSSGEAHAGWGIPMATDIAFALGILFLLGDRIPLPLKIFLTALAIVDDLGAVLVIAFFYTSDISITNLSIGIGFIAIMFLANKMGVRNILFYAICGILGVWTAFLLSGIHATIAAVLAAFTIPSDIRLKESLFVEKINHKLNKFRQIDPKNKISALTNEQLHLLDEIKTDTNHVIPPLQRLEHAMHPFVTFIVLPVFALANAGVSFKDVNMEQLFEGNVLLGVTLGLLIGKVVGIVGFSWMSIKLKITPQPTGMTFRNLVGLGLLGAIGFTMSLFVTSLAFTNEMYITQAKIGIFAASISGGILGYFILKKNK
jgi:NhaA family Na+:H+ antiporter